MSILTAYIITFIASFCILVIEIVAGRILAPFVGVSLYTWTSIIGVVLAGISIGAFAGGKLADRHPEQKTLGNLLFVSGLTTLMIPPVTNLIAGQAFPTSLMVRILIVTSVIFFIPSFILGMISPVVVKLALKNVETAGNVVGRIYAVSTLGSIIGTFAAGFYLISWMGTRHIIMAVGIILILTAVVWGGFLRSRKPALGALLVPVLFLWGTYNNAFIPAVTDDTLYYRESDYYTIKVKQDVSREGRAQLRTLALDNLVHSFVNMENPLHVEYQYEKIYADVLAWRFRKNDAFRSLTIGAGGYTFPRYMELTYPKSVLDVVEIDPEVTRTAYAYLGLPENTRIRTFNEDGRWHVMNSREKYDLVFVDAYNDLSLPYHLTTREFAQQLSDMMNPGAVLLTNIIDNFQEGSFLPSYVRTLREVFGETNVHVISISPNFQKTRIATFIVMTGKGEMDIEGFEEFVSKRNTGNATSTVVPENVLNDFVMKNYSVVLRDDFAPVDNLIAPVFEARFGYNRKER